MSTPIVSVIVPCYNGERFLTQCLDSIVNQTLHDIEIICIDDGSTDRTLDILKHYEESDSRIAVIRQENSGAGAARNKGLRRAKGKYLSFLDADDFFEPDMLEKAYLSAEEYQADFVAFNSNQYRMDLDTFVATPWVFSVDRVPEQMPFTYREITGNVFKAFVGWAWDKLYRKDFVLEHDLWFQEQRTTNDMLFVFSGLVVANRIAVVDKVLAHQRSGNGESLSVTREKSWHCFYDALIALRQRLCQEGIYKELEHDYINYSLQFSLWNLDTLAEPTHTILKQKLCKEWFQSLGIAGKPESYFNDHTEYAQFDALMHPSLVVRLKENPVVQAVLPWIPQFVKQPLHRLLELVSR